MSANRPLGRGRDGARPAMMGHRPAHMMGMPTEKAKDFKGTLRRLLPYIKPHRTLLAVITAFAIGATVFDIVSPKIMGRATTTLFQGFMLKLSGVPGAAIDFAAIVPIIYTLIALYLMSAGFGYLQQYLMAGISQRIVFQLRQDVYEKIARLPLKFFDDRPYGDVLSRITNDIDNVSNTLQQSLMQLISAIVTLLGVIVMMLSISPLLTLVTLVTLPLSGLLTALVAKRSQKYFKAQQHSLGELSGHVEEMYTGHTIVKAFGRERDSLARFGRINDDLYDAGWKAQFISGLIMPMMAFVNNIGYVIVSVVGGLFVARRAIEIGDVQAFIQYSRQFGMPITQVAGIANIIQSTIASAERVFELLDEEEELPTGKDAKRLPSPRGEVRFEGVSFRYKEDVPLIEDMNLVGKPGQVVAIVGPTGAGKTTLVNLLMRFYEIDAGSIRIDGVDIREMDRKDLRRLFGMVLQDTWLFNGTIYENIAYGKEGATREEVYAAARAAHADHFIRTLPAGYETELNEEASNLSQGQKQLITIARAILADPVILILDEATSSVDTRTELLVQQAMKSLMKGRTSFVIAHRLSTIQNADLILVMNEGRFVEKGTHEELLAAGGFYADLYQSQFLGAPLGSEAG